MLVPKFVLSTQEFNDVIQDVNDKKREEIDKLIKRQEKFIIYVEDMDSLVDTQSQTISLNLSSECDQSPNQDHRLFEIDDFQTVQQQQQKLFQGQEKKIEQLQQQLQLMHQKFEYLQNQKTQEVSTLKQANTRLQGQLKDVFANNKKLIEEYDIQFKQLDQLKQKLREYETKNMVVERNNIRKKTVQPIIDRDQRATFHTMKDFESSENFNITNFRNNELKTQSDKKLLFKTIE